MGKKSGYYCAYMSVFQGRKFEISIIITYFDNFKLKPIIRYDNIHNFTKNSISSPLKVEFAQANFKFLTPSYKSHISHNTISYCFGTTCIYPTSVPDSE